MAFDKLIIKGLTGAAKSGIKMNISISSLKERLIDTTASKIEDNVPVTLPFSIKSALQGGVLPKDLLTPDVINSVPPIPESEKQQISDALDNIEATLNTVIVQKNALQGALGTITTPLTTLETLSNTVGNIITGVKGAVTTIKLLPIPSSVPPGIGIPLNVINGFSDALDTLKKVLDKFGGPLQIIPQAIKQINDILIPIVNELNSLDDIFGKIIKIIAFIRLLLSKPVSQAQIDSTLQDITSNIQESLVLSNIPEFVDDTNIAPEFPLTYKGFVLTLEFDPDNTFSFPARRVKAENNKGVKLYSVPPDQGSGEVNTSSTYSFSSSTSVLIEEVKFNIDQYLLKNPQIATSIDTSAGLVNLATPTQGTSGTSGTSGTNGYLPFGTKGIISGEVRFKGGQAWRWLGDNVDKWVEHTISYEPVGRQPFNSTEETYIKTTTNPYPRAYYKWSELKQMWEFQRIQTGV